MKTNWPALKHGCLILASVALATSPMLAQTQEPAGGRKSAAVISSVAITQSPERAAVRVEGEGRLDVRTARMHSPDRLVLDFAGARLAVDKTVIPGLSAPVRGVRLGQYRPDVARVVVDLTAASPYQTGRDGNSFVVYFESVADAPIDNGARAITASSSKEKPGFHYSDTAPRSMQRHESLTNVSVPRFALPSELTKSDAVLGSFTGNNQPLRPDDSSAQQASQQAVQQASN